MPFMEHTLNAWEQVEYAFPVNVIQLPEDRFEIKRRVLADEKAEDSHYILADVGCVPEDGRALLGIMGGIKPTDGMLEFSPAGAIRVCRKGVVHKWPAQETKDYNKEHALAVKQAGYGVILCPTTYRRILEC